MQRRCLPLHPLPLRQSHAPSRQPPSLVTSPTGLLPDALLEDYFFYQRNGSPTVLHGYPIHKDTGEEAAESQMDHYLHVALFHLRRPRATGFPGWCALVTRKSLKDDDLDLNLLDLLYAPVGSPLHLLAQLLSRLDNLSYVLAWTPKRDRLSPTPEIKLVQLPRLQLSFECRAGPDGKVRLCSIDYTKLFVPLGHPTPQQRRAAGLLKGMPHGLLLTSENDELYVLLPNVAPCRPGPCLGVAREGGPGDGRCAHPPQTLCPCVGGAGKNTCPPQGFFRIIKNPRAGDPSPKTPSPPPQTKVTIVGKNEIYNRENLVRPFLVHQVLGPKSPPPPAQKKPCPPPPPPPHGLTGHELYHTRAEILWVS